MTCNVEELGSGDRGVLVHGSGPREATWSDQLALARSLPPGPPRPPRLRAQPRRRPELRVGRRPGAVRLRVVAEPVSFALGQGILAVDALVERLKSVFAAAPTLTPEEFDARFDTALGVPSQPVERLEPSLWAAVEAIMREKPAVAGHRSGGVAERDAVSEAGRVRRLERGGRSVV